MSEKVFDLIVIGSGPAGEKAAIEAYKIAALDGFARIGKN